MGKERPQLTEKRWNRAEVNRRLLPILRHLDKTVTQELSEQERQELGQQALEAIARDREGYAQLSHVFRTVGDEAYAQWFGWIACGEQLLLDAFAFIDARLEGKDSRDSASDVSYEKEMYFASLFRISQGDKTVDLSYPFEQYYFCDGIIYRDYLFRRVELGETCKEWIRKYLPYYTRIRAWYLEHGGRQSGVGPAYHAYMQLLDHFHTRVDYEDGIRDSIQALEYERAGLGWFHRERKRQIDRELAGLRLDELILRVEDATERYEAYEAQFEHQRRSWQNELNRAPLTAFGRKKELKGKLQALDQKLSDYRAKIGLDELQKQLGKMEKAVQKEEQT